MLAWLRDLDAQERRIMTACWSGWTLGGFDGQLYSYVVPTMIALWGLSTGSAGTIGTIALLTSPFGGCAVGSRDRLIFGLHLPVCIRTEFRITLRIAGAARPMGSFITELYPMERRGTGQGFCYNGGRAVRAFFPAVVGYATAVMPLGAAVVWFCSLSCVVMVAMLLVLPETRGRGLADMVADGTRSYTRAAAGLES
jgi:hypothetical protein